MLWEEAGQVYRSRTQKIVALMLLPLGFLLAYNNFSIAAQQDPGCLNGCPADYSLLGVWLVVVPITGMALLNYHLMMKPVLRRKRNGKTG
jgi:hypothetical protein